MTEWDLDFHFSYCVCLYESERKGGGRKGRGGRERIRENERAREKKVREREYDKTTKGKRGKSNRNWKTWSEEGKGALRGKPLQTSEGRRKEEGRGERKSLDNGRSMSVPADPPRTRCPPHSRSDSAGSLMGAEGEGAWGGGCLGTRE